MTTSTCDVVIIGAGPYGLSAAAHLRTVKGLEVRVFGEPMSFWDRNMPTGMFLRSNWTATTIADPNSSLTLDAYRAASRNHLSLPVPLDRFIDYGLWYQRQAVPDLEHRKIVRIERESQGFRTLPPCLASHTSEHRDLGKFAGKQVLVVGGGQSALESAALLHEGGAEVEVIARCTRIHWLQGGLSRALHHKLGTL